MRVLLRLSLAGLVAAATAVLLLVTVAVVSWPDSPSPSVRRPARAPSGFDVRGIDVSHHQGRIDWPTVAASKKVDFVFVKATEGRTHTDRRFRQNLRGARAAGLPVGVYHYFSLCRTGEEQAAHFIRVVSAGLGENGTLDLPPVVDIEEDTRCNRGSRLSAAESEVRAWVDAVSTHFGIDPLVYSASGFRRTHLKGLHATFWMAAYSREPRNTWQFWQYSDRTVVPGVRGAVDGNVFNGSRVEFRAVLSGKVSAR